MKKAFDTSAKIAQVSVGVQILALVIIAVVSLFIKI